MLKAKSIHTFQLSKSVNEKEVIAALLTFLHLNPSLWMWELNFLLMSSNHNPVSIKHYKSLHFAVMSLVRWDRKWTLSFMQCDWEQSLCSKFLSCLTTFLEIYQHFHIVHLIARGYHIKDKTLLDSLQHLWEVSEVWRDEAEKQSS